MNDQTRNLNPCAEAYLAMCMWGEEYSKQKGGCMDFWDGISARRKELMVDFVAEIKRLPSIRESV